MSNQSNQTAAQDQALSAADRQAYQAELRACGGSNAPSAKLFNSRQEVAVHRKYKQHAAAIAEAEYAVDLANFFVNKSREEAASAVSARCYEEAVEDVAWQVGRQDLVVALLQECRKEAGVAETAAVTA
jgi:hypothetical protein